MLQFFLNLGKILESISVNILKQYLKWHLGGQFLELIF